MGFVEGTGFGKGTCTHESLNSKRTTLLSWTQLGWEWGVGVGVVCVWGGGVGGGVNCPFVTEPKL